LLDHAPCGLQVALVVLVLLQYLLLLSDTDDIC
jgi:hypothetical protein